MDLKSFADERKKKFKEHSKFISIKPGESFEGEFVGIENYEDLKYGNQVSMKFKVSGLLKSFNRPDTMATAKLVNDLIDLGVVEGTLVKIARLESDTKASLYKVELLNKTNQKNEEEKDSETAIIENELEKVFGK